MKKQYTTVEKLLSVAEVCAKEKGIMGFGMRDMARYSGLALGTIYNYFPDKDSLKIQFFSYVWEKNIAAIPVADSYIREVVYIIGLLEGIVKEYPDFLIVHPLWVSEAIKPQAREKMYEIIDKVKNLLISSLDRDKKIRKDLFSENLTKEEFALFTMRNIVAAKSKESKNVLVNVLEKTIYSR